MKTFLGFTTGLLGGTFVGMVLMSVMLITSEGLYEYLNTI